jgi:tellurite resistance protein
MTRPSPSARKLSERIKRAIADGKLTRQELHEILDIADADQHIDAEERALLQQLQHLIENGTVKQVP